MGSSPAFLMVQLEILSGKTAGIKWIARRFPVRVGRSADADLRLEEQGVWDEHFQIILDPGAGFVLEGRSDALVVTNGEPMQRAVLRNGDKIQIGAVKLQFWLGEARQQGLRLREGLVWTLLLAVCLGQIALIYWLIQ
jgi:pSer/pThr/pTyr-binding forkhead associated (FHA) protein